MPVYFIQSGQQMKIGFTADVRSRFSHIQTGNPVRLRLRGVIEGGKEVEKEIHRRFAAQRIKGEWFEISGELRDYVKSLPTAGQPLLTAGRSRAGFDPIKLDQKIRFLQVNERDAIHTLMLEHVFRAYLLDVAEVYALAKGISLSAVSKKFYGNSSFLANFRQKTVTITLSQYDRMLEQMAADWPKKVYFPKLPKIYMHGRRRPPLVKKIPA